MKRTWDNIYGRAVGGRSYERGGNGRGDGGRYSEFGEIWGRSQGRGGRDGRNHREDIPTSDYIREGLDQPQNMYASNDYSQSLRSVYSTDLQQDYYQSSRGPQHGGRRAFPRSGGRQGRYAGRDDNRHNFSGDRSRDRGFTHGGRFRGGGRDRGRNFDDRTGRGGRSNVRNSNGRHNGRGGRSTGRNAGARVPDLSTAKSTLTNIIQAEITDGFQFFMYSVVCRDCEGFTIDSRHRRRFLFEKGFWDGILKNLPEKQKDDLKKVVFFNGTFFYSGRTIPGLDPSTFPLELPIGEDNGDRIFLNKFEHYTAPKELTTRSDGIKNDEIKVDKRCADCTKAFPDIGSLLQHCQTARHKPVYIFDGEVSETTTCPVVSRPAQLDVFTSYVNNALNRALGEKLARWGTEFIDPSNMTEPLDRRGNPIGVRVYQAYCANFGVLRSTTGNGVLSLTVDLRAKIVRTMSVLDHLSRSVDPGKYKPTEREREDALRHWIGETVISMHDKTCYAVTGLEFDHSAASLPIQGLGISHAEYFLKKKGINLKYPDATPMIAVLGRRKQTIYLPPELVAGNQLERRVQEQLPLIASFVPEQRNEAIEKIREYLIPKHGKTSRCLLPALGIQLAGRLSVKAEVLPLPRILASGIEVPRRRGTNWTPILGKADFKVNPGEANHLSVILVANEDVRSPGLIFDKLCRLVNSLNSTFRFSQKLIDIIVTGQDEQHWGAVEKFLQHNADLSNIFVLDFNKPRNGPTDRAYPVIKKMLAANGYLSQFVNFKTHPHDTTRDAKKSDLILGGVARQIVQKTGARLWWVNVPRSLPTPCVFVGVDVFHAPRVYDQNLKRKVAKGSCAAVIVQIDRGGDGPSTSNQIEIFSNTYAREPGNEYELGKALEETIQVALKELDVTPASCVVWRDGIGDSSFDKQAQDEIEGIRRGLQTKFDNGIADKKVPLSYIVCQKRIDTKLLSKNVTDHPDGRFGMPHGTLVQDIQGLDYYTFYINGTAPTYSTAKPARYIVIQRDSEMKKVPLEELTWELCHDYANWAGPIKVPCVVQMAHKLAELGGGFSDSGASMNASKFKNTLHFL